VLARSLAAPLTDRTDCTIVPAMASHESSWGLIETCARELGVHPEAVRKWRERNNVPFRWHVPLIKQFASHGRMVAMDFFENLKTQATTDPETPQSEAAE